MACKARTGPYEITEGTLVRDLLAAVNGANLMPKFKFAIIKKFRSSNLVQGTHVRRQASVHAQNLAVNHGRNRHEIKHGTAVAPCIGVAILRLTLVCHRTWVSFPFETTTQHTVEPVGLRDLACLMVAAQQHDAVRISAQNVDAGCDNTHEHIPGLQRQ